MSNVSSSNGQGVIAPKLRFNGFLEDWELVRIGDVYAERSERGAENMDLLSVTMTEGVKMRSDIEGKDNSSEDKSNYKIVYTGDMVYNSMRMWQGASGISPYDGIVSPAYTILKPRIPISNGFFAALFKNERLINAFRKNSQGMTSDTWNLKYPQIETIKIHIPSVSEQEKISEFIALVDAKIAKQRILVDSLKKYKRGVIYELFVNPDSQFDVEMAAIPMSQLLTEYRNRNTEGLRVCSVAVSRGVVDQIEHLGRSFAASDTSHYGRVKFGDVVYTKSPTGDFPFGIVKQSKLNEEVAVSPLYGVYTPASYATGNLIHAYFEQYQYANNYICTLAQKGAKNTINITNQRFLEKCIRFPVKESDREYFSALLDMLTEKAIKAEKMLEYLLAQKRTLLAKMFI